MIDFFKNNKYAASILKETEDLNLIYTCSKEYEPNEWSIMTEFGTNECFNPDNLSEDNNKYGACLMLVRDLVLKNE